MGKRKKRYPVEHIGEDLAARPLNLTQLLHECWQLHVRKGRVVFDLLHLRQLGQQLIEVVPPPSGVQTISGGQIKMWCIICGLHREAMCGRHVDHPS